MRIPFFTRKAEKPAEPTLRAQAEHNAKRAFNPQTTDDMRARLGLPLIDWSNL